MARTTKTKTKKRFSQRLRTGWAACPTSSFSSFKDYARTELDKKEVGNTIRAFIRDNFSKKEAKIMLAAPEWAITLPYYTAASIEWDKLGNEFPTEWDPKQVYKRTFAELKFHGEKAIAARKGKTIDTIKIRKSPSEIVKERTDEFIANVEGVLDTFFEMSGPNDHFFAEDYSVFNELKKADAAYITAKAVHDFYLPIQQEAAELAARKPPEDLAEAYKHWNRARRKEYLLLLTNIVEDAEKFMLVKKATRKTRKPRVKSADKQVAKLQYLKDSDEFKLASIDPVNIIGAKRLYTFNPRTRTLSEFVCRSAKGFEVKGSTLQHVDEELSREARIKPDQFIPIVMQQTPTKVSAAWKKLKSKTTTPTPRLSRGTLLLKVLNK